MGITDQNNFSYYVGYEKAVIFLVIFAAKLGQLNVFFSCCHSYPSCTQSRHQPFDAPSSITCMTTSFSTRQLLESIVQTY